jgi:peptide/nickel transport system permease protein
MIRTLFARFLRFLLTCLLAWTLAFFALRLAPGDAIAAQLAGSAISPAQLSERRAVFGLDQPPLTQWFNALANLLRGDLGLSLTSTRPVSQIITEQLRPTLELAIASLLVALVIGIGCGLVIAAGSGASRRIAQGVAAFALASPVYWVGMLAIMVFSVWLRVLPSASGGGDLRGLILPAGVLGFGLSGSIARVTAGSVREVLAADFTRTARAKGLRERVILRHHALRASLPPILTVAGLQVGFLLGGAAITEALFVRPGLGQVLINAINEKDYPVVQGVILIGAFMYSLANLCADLLAAVADPRLRHA